MGRPRKRVESRDEALQMREEEEGGGRAGAGAGAA